jgi:hypothetical protein
MIEIKQLRLSLAQGTVRTSVIVWALALAIAALAAYSLGVAGDGVPSLRSTYPIPLALPAFLGFPPLFIAAVSGACFALWSKQLFRGSAEIPQRSLVLFVVSGLLSILSFVVGWGFGVRYQGAHYVNWSLGLAVAGVLVLILLLKWNEHAPTWATSALFHFVLFGWLCTYAMPYLGEIP